MHKLPPYKLHSLCYYEHFKQNEKQSSFTKNKEEMRTKTT